MSAKDIFEKKLGFTYHRYFDLILYDIEEKSELYETQIPYQTVKFDLANKRISIDVYKMDIETINLLNEAIIQQYKELGWTA